MKYAIKQKLMAFGDDFNVMDENGRKAFFVDGKAMSFGHDLSFQGTNGQEVARIKQKLMTFAPTYTIYKRKQVVGTVRKAMFTFRKTFKIDVPGQQYSVIGNMFRYDYQFYRNQRSVAKVSKRILSVRDSYGVDISEGEDEVLILCCAIVIDMVLHNKK